MADQATQPAKPCTCWEDCDKALEEKGYRLARNLSQFQLQNNSLLIVRCLPLERRNGQRLKRGEPSTMVMRHCPFCGAPI